MTDPPSAPRLSLRRRVAYGLVPPVVLLAAGELAVRLIDPEPPPALLAAPLDHPFGQQTPTFYRRHDRLFWELRPNLAEPPSRQGDRTDALGLRNPHTPGPKDRARRRVLCMGDSCTYGLGVGMADTWPQQLARDGSLDVVNAGVPGYSTYQALVLWDDRLGALDPDVIVLEYGLNDVAPWPTRDGDTFAFLTDRDRAPHVAFCARPWGSALLGWLSGRFTLRQPERLARTARPEELVHATHRVPQQEFRDNVTTLAARAPSAVFVGWLSRENLEMAPAAQATADPVVHAGMLQMAEYRAILRDVAAKGGHPYVDVESLFRASGIAPAALYVDEVHAAPQGLRLVADAVGAALRAAPAHR